MKKYGYLLLFFSCFIVASNEDMHRNIEIKAKKLQTQIQEAITTLQHKINNQVCETEEDRLELVFRFINQWRTNHFNIYHPVVLPQTTDSSEESYMHALKNTMYMTSILGLDCLERMQEQAQHLVNEKTFDQFYSQYADAEITTIVIAPEHKKIAPHKRCPVTLYDSSSQACKDAIDFIHTHEHCCASFIIPDRNKHYFAIIVYKNANNFSYIIADSYNKSHFTDESLHTLVKIVEKKESL